MQIKIDLHCHSTFSDGKATPQKIADKCLNEDIVAVVTDHNEIRGSILLADISKIRSIPAIEIGSSEGLEILAYFKNYSDLEDFYKRHIEPYKREKRMVKLDRSIKDIILDLQCYEVFKSLAHPFAMRGKNIYNHDNDIVNYVFNAVDAIEIVNGELLPFMNKRALALNNELNKKITIGSDSHSLNTLGSVVGILEISSDYSVNDLYAILVKNDFSEVIYLKKKYRNYYKTLLTIAQKHTRHYLASQYKL